MIAKWKMKAIVQKGISYLPKKERINYWFQKNITKGVNLTDEYFGYKITHASDHIKYYEKYTEKDLKESTVLELGTGWYPIVPIAFYLSDIHKTYSLDLSDWMTLENIKTTCKKFIEWDAKGELRKYLSNVNEEKWSYILKLAEMDGGDIDEVCTEIKLHRVIGDARSTSFEKNSLDFICSNNTFEHIPEVILVPILVEFKRIISNSGVMSHFIDMSDHFAHFDDSINIYNFLKYSDEKWNRIDNSIQPQNRMRFKDYKHIYKEIDLPITEEDYRKGDMEEVKKIALDAKYKNYSLEELAISHGYLISKFSSLV